MAKLEDLRYPIPDDVSVVPVLRALVRCYRKLERESSRHLERLGVTAAQFDILATLGDTAGMSCKILGERSLTTQGTLHPVLDRLEAKGLVRRQRSTGDQRQVIVSVTPQGQELYERTFLPHVTYLQSFIARLTPAEQQTLAELLEKLEAALP
jgi:DNA-binding MarR family transcriptional regulator